MTPLARSTSAPAGVPSESGRCKYVPSRAREALVKVASFYASPSVSFALDLSTYVLFLIFLSLMAIVGFLPMVEAADVILCIWVGAYVVEELRQVCTCC